MSVKKKEQAVKPDYSKNLETLLKEKGLLKKDLAEMVHTSVQTISKACNGVRLSKGLAEDIIALFPEYNISWLLGYSSYKLESDVDLLREQIEKTLLQRSEIQWKKLEGFYEDVASIACYVGFNAEYKDGLFAVEPSYEMRSKQDYEAIKLRANPDEMEELREDIISFMSYRLTKLIKRRH